MSSPAYAPARAAAHTWPVAPPRQVSQVPVVATTPPASPTRLTPTHTAIAAFAQDLAAFVAVTAFICSFAVFLAATHI